MQLTVAEVTIALENLVSVGVISRGSKRRGHYRAKDEKIEELDYKNAEDKPLDIWLPFGLHRFVNLYAGNIVIIDGISNSGKSALLLNIASDNEDKFSVHYFSSEMGSTELKIRLNKFAPYKSAKDFKFRAFERNRNFADVIATGAGNINIIDYMEVENDFWKVSQYIREIWEKLDGAVAFIARQKRSNEKYGRGGEFGIEKARLTLSIDYGIVTISKAKNYAIDGLNPNGGTIEFSLVNGHEFRSKRDWQWVDHTRKETKKDVGF